MKNLSEKILPEKNLDLYKEGVENVFVREIKGIVNY
jgi:hypothetical protein